MAKKFAIVLLFFIAFIMMLFNKTDSVLIDKTSSLATNIFSPIVEVLTIPAKVFQVFLIIFMISKIFGMKTKSFAKKTESSL